MPKETLRMRVSGPSLLLLSGEVNSLRTLPKAAAIVN